jgi:putative MATE family efflux protein
MARRRARYRGSVSFNDGKFKEERNLPRIGANKKGRENYLRMNKEKVSTTLPGITDAQPQGGSFPLDPPLEIHGETSAPAKPIIHNWTNRRLFSLLWPLVVEQLLIVMMGIVDMVMVSSIGEHAVSGVSLVDTVNFIFINAFTALATGGSVVTSQYIGRRDWKNADGSAKQLIYVSMIISFFLMILTLSLRRLLLSLIYGRIADDVMHAGQIYFLFISLSYPFLALYSAASAMFRSMGNSKITMRIALIVNIFNMGGNAFFIYVMGWGVGGAALSTLIGRIIAAFALFIPLLRSTSNVINIRGISKISFNRGMIMRILNIGIPSGLESSLFQMGKIIVTRIFTVFGTAAIAANAVTSTINSIAFMPGSAFGMGLLIIAGQCIGAGDYMAVKKHTKKIMIISYIVYVLININILIFLDQIISIFNLSGESRLMCIRFLRIHCIFAMLFWCPSFVLPNALKAAGDARYTMIVAIGTMWAVRLCSAYLMTFPLGLGPQAVWVAMGMDFMFRGIFYTIRWRRGRWMTKKVI